MTSMMQRVPENQIVDVVSPTRIEIVEQPNPDKIRFRYESERSENHAGNSSGVHNTCKSRINSSVRIVGYTGSENVVILASLVTKDSPYRTHPHNLVGAGCEDGICRFYMDKKTMTAKFSNLGIQYVKKKDIESTLKLREAKKVDPFDMGFEHAKNPSQIDLKSVRLCFQASLESEVNKRLALPVVSRPIYHRKSQSDLQIIRLCHASASVKGGTHVLLFCGDVGEGNIEVRFYEEIEGYRTWESVGTISLVHKRCGIDVRTPAYRTLEVDRTVEAFIQLYRPSDGAVGEPLQFKFTPIEPGPLRPKKPKLLSDLLQMNGIRPQRTMYREEAYVNPESHDRSLVNQPNSMMNIDQQRVTTRVETVPNRTFGMSPNPTSSQPSNPSDFEQLLLKNVNVETASRKHEYVNAGTRLGCLMNQPNSCIMNMEQQQVPTLVKTFRNRTSEMSPSSQLSQLSQLSDLQQLFSQSGTMYRKEAYVNPESHDGSLVNQPNSMMNIDQQQVTTRVETVPNGTFGMSPNPTSSQPSNSSFLEQFLLENGTPFAEQNCEMFVDDRGNEMNLFMLGSQLQQLGSSQQTFPNQPEQYQSDTEFPENMSVYDCLSSVEGRNNQNDSLHFDLEELSDVIVSKEDIF